MEQKKEVSKFSWTGLFIVTAFCFISFSCLIKFLNGSANHSALFLNIGFITLGLTVLSFINDLTMEPEVKKEEGRAFHHLPEED